MDYCDGLLVAVDSCIRRALERAGKKLNTMGRKGRAPYLNECEAIKYHTVLCITEDLIDRKKLLSGAWDRTPEIASWYDLDADKLAKVLEAYCRNLLVTGTGHEFAKTVYIIDQIS